MQKWKILKINVQSVSKEIKQNQTKQEFMGFLK